MKICEYVGSMCSGGAENFVRLLSLCARKAGHEITVLLLWRIEPDNAYEIKAIQFKYKDDLKNYIESNKFPQFQHCL